jgi:hypothetical protein
VVERRSAWSVARPLEACDERFHGCTHCDHTFVTLSQHYGHPCKKLVTRESKVAVCVHVCMCVCVCVCVCVWLVLPL